MATRGVSAATSSAQISSFDGRFIKPPYRRATWTASRNAALAKIRVESRTGSAESASPISKGNSVQPNTTASQPRRLPAAMTSLKYKRVDSLSIVKRRYLVVDSSRVKLGRVDSALHQVLRAEDEYALEAPFDGNG